MAKDRFSKFKPINWNSEFKQTGSFIKPEIVKPKKELRDPEVTKFLVSVLEDFEKYMTKWEYDFIKSIILVPFKCSSKQVEIIKKIIEKCELHESFI